MKRVDIRPGYSISRVIKGGWHLAGGHGRVGWRRAVDDMRAFVEAGITTFDCADIYTGVEELIGRFLRDHRDAFRSGALAPVQVQTKYVPDYDRLPALRPADTTKIIDRSLRRLGVDRLDMVQFAWWDYSVPGYVETALHLAKLQSQGKIRLIGVTNFDAARLMEILEAGVDVAAAQVQYSVLDQRPEGDLTPLARKRNIALLCYGSLAGGFLSDRFLGVEDPRPPLENRSLVKYRLIIDEFGGYDRFQRGLRALRSIADRHGVGIAEVAARYILQKPGVAAVIIGARNRDHLDRLLRLDRFHLDDADLEAIASFTARARGPTGPVYQLERDKEGKHGVIMKYNLNTADE
jgi:aryl-alcohol dehydrogenase-like predicted oxidoreductase